VWPGLLSTALVSAGVLWLAIAPVGSLFIDRTHDAIQWGFLIVNGVVVSVLSEVLRRAVRRAQTSQRLLDQVVQGTSDAVFVKDTQGRYVLAN
jgi:PAS domain-containing protein